MISGEKLSFADPDGPHPLIKPFRRRFGSDHEGSGFYPFCASYSRPEKNSTDPAFPTRWINIEAVKRRNSLKRGRHYPNDADDFARAVLCH